MIIFFFFWVLPTGCCPTLRYARMGLEAGMVDVETRFIASYIPSKPYNQLMNTIR